MSGHERTAETSSGVNENRRDYAAQGQNLRFTPLRSYVIRARALTRGVSGEMARSRIVPVPRLQS